MARTDRTGLRQRQHMWIAGPVRTCVGCRRSDSWSVLLRVVVGTGTQGLTALAPDPRHRAPGRGCWLHPTRTCLDLALRRRAFPRALKFSAPLDPAPITAYVEALLAGTALISAPPTMTGSGFDADERPMSTQQ